MLAAWHLEQHHVVPEALVVASGRVATAASSTTAGFAIGYVGQARTLRSDSTRARRRLDECATHGPRIACCPCGTRSARLKSDSAAVRLNPWLSRRTGNPAPALPPSDRRQPPDATAASHLFVRPNRQLEGDTAGRLRGGEHRLEKARWLGKELRYPRDGKEGDQPGLPSRNRPHGEQAGPGAARPTASAGARRCPGTPAAGISHPRDGPSAITAEPKQGARASYQHHVHGAGSS